jgi:predicted esterase YcpF (UPF0227 family)
MEKPNILFFHGYGSMGDTSNTAKLLKAEFGEYNVITPSYDYDCAGTAYTKLDRLVYSLVKVQHNSELILVGTSLGGFWANHFCERYNLKAILVNPCLDPVNLLKKYPNADCASYSPYYKAHTLGKHKTIILGKQDEVIPYTTFLDALKPFYSIFIDDDMGHRVTNPTKLIECIKQSYMNVYCR